MLSFKEFLYEQQVLAHKFGTYVCLNLDPECSKKLFQWAKDQGIETPIEPNEMHCTVTYSKKGVPEAKDYLKKFKFPIKVSPSKTEIFDNGKNRTLVLRVNPSVIDDHHTHIQNEYGATYDFDEYKPHVSLAYGYEGKNLKAVPDFDIIFDSVKMEPLREDVE